MGSLSGISQAAGVLFENGERRALVSYLCGASCAEIGGKMIETLQHHDPGQAAIIQCSDNRIIRYDQLASMVDRQRRILAELPRPALAILYCDNTIGSTPQPNGWVEN